MSEEQGGEFDFLDEFVEEGKKKVGGGSFDILKWKKEKDPPQIDALMSMRRKPTILYRHSLPKLVSYEKDGVAVERVFSDRYRCYEDPKVFYDKENKRDWRKTGLMKVPPRVCPICLFYEWVFAQVWDGKLGDGFQDIEFKIKGELKKLRCNTSLIEPLFRMQGEDDKEEKLIHAGGFCKLFNDKMDEGDQRIVSREGINLTEAWSESGAAGKNFLFTILDYDDVEGGLQKTIEPGQLGEAVIEEMGKAIEGAKNSKNPEKGNPFKFPYVIRWKHFPKRKFPLAKYEAVRMPDMEVSDEMMEILRGDPPDDSRERAYFDKDEMRTFLETNCLLKGAPWDKFFGGSPPGETARSDSAKAPSGKSEERATPREEKAEASARDLNPLKLAEEDAVACACPVEKGSKQECGGWMRETDTSCPVCRAVYEGSKIVRFPWETAKEPPKASTGPKRRAAAAEEPDPLGLKGGSTGKGDPMPPF